MLEKRLIHYSLLHFRRRKRMLYPFIRNNIVRIVIFLCTCSLLTFIMFKRSYNTFGEISMQSNTSADNARKDVTVIGQVRTVRLNNYNEYPTHSRLQFILLWTKYFSEEYSNGFYFFSSGQKTFEQYNCKYSNCFVTSNRSLLSVAKAVIFHATDLNFSDIPQRPHAEQTWILYSLEPPRYIFMKWKLIQSLFNWTMTYRSDSDIQVKYGEVVARNDSCSLQSAGHESVLRRPKGAIWMVSNCRTQGRREAYVKELRKFLDVEVYGKCSHRRCEPKQSEACYKLLKEYKYYLSFENSICKDYVTEKFFNVLLYDIVPVVFGGADYAAIAPENSFVDATQFPSPKKLAEHLARIAENSSWYDSFFEWKTHYSVHLHPWMCDLCERLNKQNGKIQRVPKHLWSWWVPGALCRRWTKKKGFKNIFET